MDSEKISKYSTYSLIAGGVLGVVSTVIFPPSGAAGIATILGAAGTWSAATAVLGGGVAAAHELWLNSFRGKVVQIFGPKQVGKNSVYNAITESDETGVDPTSESTKKIYAGNSRTLLKILKGQKAPTGFLKDIYEIAGEKVSKWKEVIEETNPEGIIYLVTSCTEFRDNTKMRKIRFELEVQGLYEICKTLESLKQKRPNRIKAFVILVNKADMVSVDGNTISNEYKNELSNYPDKNNSVFQFLTKVTDCRVPVLHFCADSSQRDNYKDHNSKVILNFWKELLK